MRALRRTWKRLTGTFASARREDELAIEMQAHVEMQTEDNRACGIPEEEAHRQALLKFGGVESAKESYRDQRGLPQVDAMAQDTRYALRAMRKNPGFAAVAILSLALGIAATTSIFSIVNSALLRTLAYRDPARLVAISVGGAVSAPLYDTFRREARSIEQAALFVNVSLNLAGGNGEPERVPAARVSASLFGLLGVKARLGRTFTRQEDQPKGDTVVIIGDSLWKRRFGGDPHVLGRKLLVNGVPQTVIGIMPPGFQFPDGPELPIWAGTFPPAEMWRPMAMLNDERTCGGCWNFAMIARLRPGIPPSQARAELRRILRDPVSEPDLTVRSLKDTVSRQARRPLAILFVAVVVSLLIACVNVANLLIARGLRRQPEIALRISLGAARSRVVRQLLTESLVLALCSALLAIPLSAIAIRALVAIAPAGVPGISAATLDARVLAFALALALLTTLLFGTAPALATAHRDTGDALKSGGRGAAGTRSSLRTALIAAEFALSLVLVVAASLLAKSFVAVAHTPLGFHAENVLTMRLLLPDARYNEKQRAALADQLIARCAALPGVISAAAVSTLPLTGEAEGWGLGPDDADSRQVMFRVRAITPAYFRTLGIRLRSGRETSVDDRGTNLAAVVSQLGARLRWPGVADPVGRKLAGMTVVGIVDDTRASGLDTEVHPYLYIPFSPHFAPEEFALAVRSASDPARLAAAVKSEIWRVAKDQPVTHVAVMRQLVADSIAPRRFEALLMALFAAFALLLAAVGIYGVVAYSVAQHTHEIGIRMALGASRGVIVTGVLFRTAALAFAGTALGLAAAFAIVPLLRSLLYGVNVVDPPVFVASALLLIAVAVLAGLLPALRAARVDPMVCLRYE
jgi:putative ABC transport system permease protein